MRSITYSEGQHRTNNQRIALFCEAWSLPVRRNCSGNCEQVGIILLILGKHKDMRYQGREQSKNVEDRRGGRGKAAAGFGIGTIILIVLAMIFSDNPGRYISMITQNAAQSQAASGGGGGELKVSAEEQALAELVKVTLKDTEDVWHKIFREQIGKQYREPNMVLFSGKVESACGFASAATGPFYCPADMKLYIDLSFYQQLKQRFRAGGDFAMAYVVAHEVAHHVQNLLGITNQVHRLNGRVSKAEYNDQSVRLELQADFLAGVWAHYAHKMKNILEEGDVEEALNAAHAIGDDNIQKQSQGYVVPDSFTHGTSEQRVRWFRKGLETGDINQGDTFNTRVL